MGKASIETREGRRWEHRSKEDFSFFFFFLAECLAREHLFIASSVAKQRRCRICLPAFMGVPVAGLQEILFVRHKQPSPMTAVGTNEDSPCCLCRSAGTLQFTLSRDAELKLFWLALEITQLLLPRVEWRSR